MNPTVRQKKKRPFWSLPGNRRGRHLKNSQRGKPCVHTLQSGGWQKQKEFGRKRVKTETCFHCWGGCGAAEERETDCREEGERGFDQQGMPAAEGDAARVGEGGRLRVCTSSCGGGFMCSEGSCAAPCPPWSPVQLLVSVLRRNATDPKENQRAQLHLDQGKLKEWADVAPVGSDTKAWWALWISTGVMRLGRTPFAISHLINRSKQMSGY